MKKLFLLLVILIVSLTLLVGCNKANIDDMIITPDELDDNVSDTNNSPSLDLESEEELVKEDVNEEIESSISLKDIDEFSVIVNDAFIGRPSYGASEEYEMNMMLSATKFPNLDHLVISFNPLCGKPSTIRVIVAGSLLAEEAFACDKNHEVLVPKSVLSEGYNVILLQSKVTEDFYLDDVEITFHYLGQEAEVYPGDNFFFKESDDAPSTTLQKLADVSLQNTLTRTFRLKESHLIEPLYLEFDVSTDEADLLLLLNGESVPYDVKKGTVSVLLPKNLLLEGTNELSFVALTN